MVLGRNPLLGWLASCVSLFELCLCKSIGRGNTPEAEDPYWRMYAIISVQRGPGGLGAAVSQKDTVVVIRWIGNREAFWTSSAPRNMGCPRQDMGV